MRRLLIDTSNQVWLSLLSSRDNEFGVKVMHEGKEVHVNGWKHGYEIAINHIVAVMQELQVTPNRTIFVVAGQHAKARREMIYPNYKKGKDSRPPEAYVQFNLCRDALLTAFLNLGAQTVTQDGVEEDDTLAYLCKHLDGEKVVLTTDGDLGTTISDTTSLWRNGQLTKQNPYGPFSPKYIPVYKALVGDGDEYKGAHLFGPKAFLDFLVWAGEGGLAALEGIRVGLADNWIRHVTDVRDRHRDLIASVEPQWRHDVLCELNAIEQVVNIAQTTVMLDAWGRGQKVTLHGWCYGLKDGLINNLHMTVDSTEGLDALYRAAIAGVAATRRG